MATKYTAGIIDGTTKDFKEYAKLCMRAFSVTMHMRDEPLNKAYEEANPSSYHIKKLEKLRAEKKELAKIDDKVLLNKTKKELELEYSNNIKRIEELKNTNDRLRLFLKKAKEYESPTPKHNVIKDFMISQLEQTLDLDVDYSFYEESNIKIKARINNLNASVVRLEKLRDIEKNISYHLKSNKQEEERCEKSNLWVLNFMESLKD